MTRRLLWFRLAFTLISLLNIRHPLYAAELTCQKKVCTVGRFNECGKSCFCNYPNENTKDPKKGECGPPADYEYVHSDMTLPPTQPGLLAQPGLQAQPAQQPLVPIPGQHAQSPLTNTAHLELNNPGGVQPGVNQQLLENGEFGAGGRVGAFPGTLQQSSENLPMGGAGGSAAIPGGLQGLAPHGQIGGGGLYGGFPGGSQISYPYGQMDVGGGYAEYAGGLQQPSSYDNLRRGGGYAYQSSFQQYPQYGPSKGHLALQGVNLGMQTLLTTLQMRNQMPRSVQSTYSSYDMEYGDPAAWPSTSLDGTPAATLEQSTSPSLPPKPAAPAASKQPLPASPTKDGPPPSPPFKGLPPPPASSHRPPPVPSRGKQPPPSPALPNGKLLPPPPVPPRGIPMAAPKVPPGRSSLHPPPVPPHASSSAPPKVPPRRSSLPPPPVPQHGNSLAPRKAPRRVLSLRSPNRRGSGHLSMNKPRQMFSKPSGLKLKLPRLFKG